MTENKDAIAMRFTEPRSVDPDDAPELNEEWFARADLKVGGKLVRRGRPKSDAPKVAVKLRLDPEVLDHFKAGGPGWQSRINAALQALIAGK